MMKDPIMPNVEGLKTQNEVDKTKEFEFHSTLGESDGRVWDALYNRNINAEWSEVRRQILSNLSTELGRDLQDVERERIENILDESPNEFKHPSKHNIEGGGTLTFGLKDLQKQIIDELNARE